MITVARTHRSATISLVGAALVLALGLSGCASDTTSDSPAGASSRPATATSSGSTQDVAAVSPASESAEGTAAGAAAAPLSSLLLRQSDLPADYGTGATAELGSTEVLGRVRSCLDLPDASNLVEGSAVSPSYSYTDGGVASAAVRYRTQGAADADAALLLAPKAEECFRTVLLKQFNSGGTPATGVTVSVRPGTNDGPSNEVGIVSLNFVQDQGREGMPTISVSTYWFGGPRTLTALTFVGFGNEFDQDLSTTLVGTIATRTARG